MTNNLRENLDLVEVVYENGEKKAVLKFLDIENGELLEVNFNKQVYENGGWVDNEEKAKKVDEWCKEYFDRDFDKLTERVGDKFNVYKYEKFNSMWETKVVNKFDVKQKGEIFNTTISEITDTGSAISIRYEIDGNTYETKFTYGEYMEGLKQWFTNPQKKIKQFEKFEKTFGISFDEKETIIGKEIMIEIKTAFGKYAYAEIKKPKWAK